MLAIIDYGMGNLGSVSNACRYLDMPCRIVDRPEAMTGCEAVILPGVGAFGDCMEHLAGHGFVAPLKEWVASGKPFLGICLGLQVLYASSEESPEVPGLGILDGKVRRFPASSGLKIPQIGWNSVKHQTPDCPLFAGIPDQAYVYFVHSYYVENADPTVTAGETTYGPSYTSAIWRDNLMAVQFHPEKSQRIGLRMLQNFGDWAYERVQPR
jgi:imidazole glycerol-phosphate synthase subunit HisH